MKNYLVEESTGKEYGLVDNGIVEYNLLKVPFTQKPSFMPINRIIKGSNGDMLAGLNSILYCWNCLYIGILWVRGEFIDTPLDIAMASRILRYMINKPSNLLKDDLNCYLSRGRIAYLEMIKTIKPSSNCLIDGSLSADKIVNQIMEQISKLDEC